MSRLLVFSFLAAAWFIGHAGAVHAGTVAESLSEEVRVVFEHSRNAVVKVEAADKNGPLRGTGFFIDPNGTVLTSYSVGGDSRDIVISHGDVKTPARRLVADCRSGIAILQIEGATGVTPFLPLTTSKGLAVATPVVTVAYPMDLPLTPNFGMVAGFNLKYLGRYFATTHIRANVPVQRGEGGAPLMNMQGEVVGIVISGLDNGAACFALPIEAAEKIHRDYVRFGAARPGYLGVVVRGAYSNSAPGSTAEVESVEQNTPAAVAGIKKGDVILRIGASEIKAPEDVLNASFYLTAGERIPFTVWREEKELTLEVEPAARAESPRPRRGLRGGAEDITLRPER